MSSYKVDADKGFKILMATFPNLVFINGPRFSDVNAFAERFKSVDVNLLSIDNVFERMAKKFILSADEIANYFASEKPIENPDLESALIKELHAYMNRFRTTPCIIVGNIANIDVVLKIFDEQHSIFTYVYVYPNSDANYKRSVVDALGKLSLETLPEKPTDPFLQLLPKSKDRDTKIDAYVKQMMAMRKRVFKTHSDQIGHTLVILDKII